MDISNWSKEDFRAMTLLYAALSSAEVSDEELKIIAEKVGKEHFKKIERVTKQVSDYDMLQCIQKNWQKFYPEENGKEKLLEEVEEIFKSDGHYSQFEKVVLKHLSRLM